jgi:nucleotide-binding universal stress UspA family protein
MAMNKEKKKKVLIALEFDKTAQKVAETGYSMAKAMKAEVVLLHVISEPVYFSATDYSPVMGNTELPNPDLKEFDSEVRLKKMSQHFLDNSKLHLGDTTIKTILKEGDYAGNILDAAKELYADVIVMGSNSRKWFDNIILGSVTEKVLHHSTIPIYIVPTAKCE